MRLSTLEEAITHFIRALALLELEFYSRIISMIAVVHCAYNATLLYMLNLYNHAFSYFRMGYASALAVMLFLVVFGITLIVYRTSDRWVYYS